MAKAANRQDVSRSSAPLFFSASTAVSFADVNVHETLHEGLASSVFRVSSSGFTFAMKTIAVPYENAAQRQEMIDAIFLAENLAVHRHVVEHLGHDLRDFRCYRQYMVLYTGSLMTLLNLTPTLGVSMIVDIALQVARGLEHIHQCNIIHRDVKCENVMLETDRGGNENSVPVRVFKLGDFLECCTATKTGIQRRANVGTPGFMAPEVYSERELSRVYDQQCDVWSFGMLLYQLLMREFPPADVSVSGLRPMLTCAFPRAAMKFFVDLFNGCTEREPGPRNKISVIVQLLNSFDQRFE